MVGEIKAVGLEVCVLGIKVKVEVGVGVFVGVGVGGIVIVCRGV
jgi:hypothetical protein